MTAVTGTAVKALLTSSTTVTVRPRYEGSNIGTWIGFKHINYLIEEAVLDHFRQAGLPARGLYGDHGLGLDLVGLDTRILSSIHMDDEVRAEVRPFTRDGDETIGFKVALHVERDGVDEKAITSKVRVSLRIDDYLEPAAEVPAELAGYAVRKLGDDLDEKPAVTPAEVTAAVAEALSSRPAEADGTDPVLAALTAGQNAYAWKWRIGYPYCHFTERLQMSGYLRLMEEAKDRFVYDRGISIKTLLDECKWIPAVPHSQIRILDEARMEEDLYTVYTVENIFKDFVYTSRMDCYVVRDGELVLVATGKITHGYAVIENRRDWGLVSFDERVLAALRGDARSA
ncbi:hypothetical protein [Streptomyces sp. TP-A0874]|uniref:hypothetical protein n=1 Tax=Streptomyces sp. TP-A0874 TaxID=549819 RepID=UPI000853B993|nr:hypothetical protein [Streptomyces sp. TP-A0874]